MIKNYTSEVAAAKSILHIERRLTQNNVRSIMKTFEGERVTGIAFIVSTPGGELPFKLPANVDRVEKKLLSLRSRVSKSTARFVKEQAERTAWKILADWIDIQMTLVELDQAEMAEVFMPYLHDYKTDTTLFDHWKKNGFTALIEDKSKGAQPL